MPVSILVYRSSNLCHHLGSSLYSNTEGTTSKVAIDATKPLGDTKVFEKAVLPQIARAETIT